MTWNLYVLIILVRLFLIFLTVIVFSLIPLNAAKIDVNDEPCSNTYENRAYMFGKKIQKLISNEDLEGLAKLIEEDSYPYKVEYLLT